MLSKVILYHQNVIRSVILILISFWNNFIYIYKKTQFFKNADLIPRETHCKYPKQLMYLLNECFKMALIGEDMSLGF